MARNAAHDPGPFFTDRDPAQADRFRTARGIITGLMICIVFWSFVGLGFTIGNRVEGNEALSNQEAFSGFRIAGQEQAR